MFNRVLTDKEIVILVSKINLLTQYNFMYTAAIK